MKTNDEIASKSNIKLKFQNAKGFNNIKINNNKKANKRKNKKKKIIKKKYFWKKKEEKNLIIKYNDYEINNFSYKQALKLDKRSYFQYYISLLKTKHLLIFTFYTKSDYNSKIIKIILFLFSFSLYLTNNALFFNDSTIHRIYEDLGKFNFIYQISNIFYSSIISSFITLIIKYLSLTEKNIIEIKNEKNNGNIKISKILNIIIIKIFIFCILCFAFLIFFWFYLSCFCKIYQNTQIHLISDTLISFALSLLYPFIINLFSGLLRISSLKSKDKEIMYKISLFIQLI